MDNTNTNTNANNTNNTNNMKTENILAKLKTLPVAISVGTIYVFLILLTIGLLYSTTSNSSSTHKNKTTDNNSNNSNSTTNMSLTFFVAITFILLCIVCVIILIPSFKEIKTLIGQMQNVLYVILYVIFLILFFRLLPSNILNKYAFIFTPLTLIGVCYFFYNAFKTNYINKFNLNYERIKMIILFFSLITTLIIYYSVDPGGYIQKNLGYSLLLTILIAIFSFLYLIIVLTLQTKTTMKGGAVDFSNFNPYIWFINACIVVFILLLVLGIKSNPSEFISNTGVSTAVIIFTMLILIIWASILAVTYYPDITNKVLDDSKLNLFSKSISVIFGIVISGLIIAWITYIIQNFTGGETSTVSLLLSIILALVILTFIYKIVNVKAPSNTANKSNATLELIKNIIFYIPCLFSGFFDTIMRIFIKEYNSTNISDFYYILFTFLVLIIYFAVMLIKGKFFLQGGKQLINEPINTNILTSVATYDELNGNNNENFNYQYGLSFWLYIDSMPPNNNASYSKYTSLLNYGHKPNILYKADTNTLLITMDSGRVYNLSRDLTYVDSSNNETSDENKNIIVYKKENYLLQKWNQIIINYNGGTLDIFMNGELVKTVVGIVPYMSLDTLTVGSSEGIQGGVCNLLYFKKPLTATNIYYLYNSVKNKQTPTS